MNTPLRIAIVDDEALARLRLHALLQATTEIETQVVGEGQDATEALLLLETQTVDLLLLDIRMPGDDGLKLARAIKALAHPPWVIFVTAFAEGALAAFDLDAVDYLTKPVRRERLLAALQRVQQRMGAAAAPAGLEGPALVVSDRGRVLRLPHAEVLYLKAEQKYVTLRTAEHSYVLDDTLTDLEQRLGEDFIRVHRNALVAKHAIRALELRSAEADPDDATDGASEGWAVRVAPLDEWLAVSRRQVAAVRAALAADDAQA